MSQWRLFESGFNYDTIEAESVEAALEVAKDNVDRDNYESSDKTFYVDVLVQRDPTFAVWGQGVSSSELIRNGKATDRARAQAVERSGPIEGDRWAVEVTCSKDKIGTEAIPDEATEFYAELEGEEESSALVAVEPEEPKCPNGKHTWEETSLRGNAGGVIIKETCSTCGCVRTTNTWAQNPSTGQQGLRSVEYTVSDDDDQDQVVDYPDSAERVY
jgi:hypothetical protein